MGRTRGSSLARPGKVVASAATMANPLRGRLMVGRLTLDQVVKVRVLAPQLSEDPLRRGFVFSAKGGDLTDEADVYEPCPSISRPRPDDRVRRRVQLRQETVRYASSPRRRGAGGCARATRGRARNARENLFDRGESRHSDRQGGMRGSFTCPPQTALTISAATSGAEKRPDAQTAR